MAWGIDTAPSKRPVGCVSKHGTTETWRAEADIGWHRVHAHWKGISVTPSRPHASARLPTRTKHVINASHHMRPSAAIMRVKPNTFPKNTIWKGTYSSQCLRETIIYWNETAAEIKGTQLVRTNTSVQIMGSIPKPHHRNTIMWL